jgi:hypothetical protein
VLTWLFGRRNRVDATIPGSNGRYRHTNPDPDSDADSDSDSDSNSKPTRHGVAALSVPGDAADATDDPVRAEAL